MGGPCMDGRPMDVKKAMIYMMRDHSHREDRKKDKNTV